jgi:hypothetical protein
LSADVFNRLQPFLVVSGPNAKGWWDANCPLHDDGKRSAGFNFESGKWSCRAGCGSGDIIDLIHRFDQQQSADGAVVGNGFVDFEADAPTSNGSNRRATRPLPTMEQLQSYAKNLQQDKERLDAFVSHRGIHPDTLDDFFIGWNPDWVSKSIDGHLVYGAYTVPILDVNGKLLNVRLYRLPSEEEDTKIWSWGSPGLDPNSLYPEQILAENNTIVLAEGEWDALITNQCGIPAVTGTTGAGAWNDKWNVKFTGKTVFIIYDKDDTGERSARNVYTRLKDFAKAVYIVQLPDWMPYNEKRGEDLSDFFNKYGKTRADLLSLMEQFTPLDAESDDDPIEVTVAESYNPSLAGKPMAMTVTVVGRHGDNHLLGRIIDYTCNMDAGTTCRGCPMVDANGHMVHEIMADNPVVLRLRDSTDKQVPDIYRELIGAHKCGQMRADAIEKMNTEMLSVRTSLDRERENDESDSRSRMVVNVGRYRTETNTTVRMVGTIYPSPKDQLSVFQAWRMEPVESSLDNYEVTDKDIKLMRLFQPDAGELPLKKIGRIANDLSHNVTRIIGRNDVHTAMDLVWHSAIMFDFDGRPIEKGWLDALFVGDARTGKSEIANGLSRHYGLGRVVSCESASIPGLLGAVKPLAGGKGWSLEWGAIPLSDRRLVALDEAAGLSPEQIGQLSSVRSSGIAEITKAQTESTRARTRLIWMANPRDNRFGMSHYMYGVRAIQPLIGNQEDIARFDFAMTLSGDDVGLEKINRPQDTNVRHVYTDEACHTLLRWVWSRRRDQVLWSPGSTQTVYEKSLWLADQYVADPPLIQGANVRTKIARIAVAIAARTFSTDTSCENIVVNPVHVEEAVRFLHTLYSNHRFGYLEESQRVKDEERAAIAAQDEAVEYIRSYPGLARFLYSSNGQFRRQQIEEMLNKSREEANAIIQRLVVLRMIATAGDWDYRIQPQLNIILRERIKEK